MNKKIKRLMYFETDDAIELDEHYQGRLTNLNATSYGSDGESYEAMRNRINQDYFYDVNVLRYRQMHPIKYRKWLNKYDAKMEKLNPSKLEEPDEPQEQPETPPKPIQCTAVVVAHRDLSPSPTETCPDAVEEDEE